MATPLDEYKSAGENIRWYSHIRFAQLTLFTALTAAIFTLAFSQTLALNPLAVVLLKLGGAVVALSHWILEARADLSWSHYMARASQLEKGLKFKQYSTRPRHKIRTSFVIRGLLCAVSVFWIISILIP
jgi:hypothetical protein